MSKLTEKAAYLKGLAEGLGLAPDTPERKLILALLDTVDEMATAMGAMEQRIQDAEDSIDEVSDDLADVEEIVYEDEDDECDCGCEDEPGRRGGVQRGRLHRIRLPPLRRHHLLRSRGFRYGAAPSLSQLRQGAVPRKGIDQHPTKGGASR